MVSGAIIIIIIIIKIANLFTIAHEAIIFKL